MFDSYLNEGGGIVVLGNLFLEDYRAKKRI